MCLHNVKCCFLEFDSDASKVRQVLVDCEKNNNKFKRSDAGQNLLCISAACRIPVSISITILSQVMLKSYCSICYVIIFRNGYITSI